MTDYGELVLTRWTDGHKDGLMHRLADRLADRLAGRLAGRYADIQINRDVY